MLTKNDYLCEWTLDLNPILKIVQQTQFALHLKKDLYENRKDTCFQGKKLDFEYDNTFWLSTESKGKEIKVRLDLRILPKKAAE